MLSFELQLCAAFLLDLLFGDPRWFPHPVKIIGMLCRYCENFFRKVFLSEFLAGSVTVATVLGLILGGIAFLLFPVASLYLPAAKLLAVFLLYTSLAARDLVVHSRAVYAGLKNTPSLEHARQAVARIVGRDTAALDRKEIVRACVETVAENMVDGVTAPLFYAICGSLLAPLTGIDPLFLAVLGGLGYKGVNTMDSMFGYKNERYQDFGRTAARLDDLLNFIPARLSGCILVPAAFLMGLNGSGAWRVYRRDRLAHASPNAGHSEAAFAGALGIQLGGSSSYFGKTVVKPVIGDARREVEENDILLANKLMLLGSFLFFTLMLLLRRFVLTILI